MTNALRFLRNNAIALTALFVALSGTSYALATGSIDSREIKNKTIKRKDIAAGVALGQPLAIEARKYWSSSRENPVRHELPCPDGWRALSGGSRDPHAQDGGAPMFRGGVTEHGGVDPIGWRVTFAYQGERPDGFVTLYVVCAPLS